MRAEDTKPLRSKAILSIQFEFEENLNSHLESELFEINARRLDKYGEIRKIDKKSKGLLYLVKFSKYFSDLRLI